MNLYSYTQILLISILFIFGIQSNQAQSIYYANIAIMDSSIVGFLTELNDSTITISSSKESVSAKYQKIDINTIKDISFQLEETSSSYVSNGLAIGAGIGIGFGIARGLLSRNTNQIGPRVQAVGFAIAYGFLGSIAGALIGYIQKGTIRDKAYVRIDNNYSIYNFKKKKLQKYLIQVQ